MITRFGQWTPMVIMVPRIAFEIVEIGTSVLAKRRQDGMSALAVFAAEAMK
jgi:hypothetical protein